MLERFEGEGGRRLRVDALVNQKLVGGNRELAERLADSAPVFAVQNGQVLIEQGAADNDVYLIFAGTFNVTVNGRIVGRRGPGDHVGEMAAIELSQRRAASIVATEPGVVARVSEAELSAIGKQYPEVYRCIAKELSRRLHQRNAHVGATRDRIRLFVISSVESLPVARELEKAFAYDNFVTTVWTNGVFRVASYPVQSLLDAVDASDFAVAIAHADDTTTIRGQNWPVTRDNVVFELGLFMGRLGRDRAVLMESRDQGVKLPSDLAGITTIPYRYQPGSDTAALMAPACHQLRDHILRLGPNL